MNTLQDKFHSKLLMHIRLTANFNVLMSCDVKQIKLTYFLQYSDSSGFTLRVGTHTHTHV